MRRRHGFNGGAKGNRLELDHRLQKQFPYGQAFGGALQSLCGMRRFMNCVVAGAALVLAGCSKRRRSPLPSRSRRDIASTPPIKPLRSERGRFDNDGSGCDRSLGQTTVAIFEYYLVESRQHCHTLYSGQMRFSETLLWSIPKPILLIRPSRSSLPACRILRPGAGRLADQSSISGTRSSTA